MSEKRTKAKIAGRKMAAELIGLCDWEDGTGADYAESLLRELKKLLPKREADIETEVKPVPIARLGATVIKFGEHHDKSYDAIPIDYLSWLCGQQEASVKSLRAYLKHPELESRRGGGR